MKLLAAIPHLPYSLAIDLLRALGYTKRAAKRELARACPLERSEERGHSQETTSP